MINMAIDLLVYGSAISIVVWFFYYLSVYNKVSELKKPRDLGMLQKDSPFQLPVNVLSKKHLSLLLVSLPLFTIVMMICGLITFVPNSAISNLLNSSTLSIILNWGIGLWIVAVYVLLFLTMKTGIDLVKIIKKASENRNSGYNYGNLVDLYYEQIRRCVLIIAFLFFIFGPAFLISHF